MAGRYYAKKTRVDGYLFDSKMEARRYEQLKLLERAKTIERLAVHPKWEINLDKTWICDVEMDFSYMENGKVVIEDVKGHDNVLSKLKRRLFEAKYGLQVTVVKQV